MAADSVQSLAPRPASAYPEAPALRLLCGLRISAGQAVNATASREPVTHEGRHHVQAVLALSGASRRGMGRDELVEVLWPKASATAGRNRLYHTVHLARQALSAVSWDDEWVMVRNARVMLDERVWCDLHQLERAGERSVGELSASELHDLVPLCNGDWMPQLDVGAIGEAVRTRVRTAQSSLLREAIVRSQSQGDTPALRELLQSLLRIQATDEWVHRELMRLDLAAGRRHAVLRTFDKLSRELSVQLGLRPSAQTIAVAAAAAAELQSPPSGGAPEAAARATSLVGREALIQSLVAQMSERAGLWNFTGLSGIGKTTLARAVAHRVAPAMADGVCVVNLGDLGAYESAASACVRTLGLTSSEQGDETELLVHAVQVRQMLLILDDIDAASDAHSLLARLPLDSMRARVIVTTRARVNLAQAEVVPVVLLPTPEPDATPAQALQSAGFALFQMRCPLASHELQSHAWQSEAVQLVRRLEGLPLAIELAAARTASMTPGEILRQIERSLRPLGDGPVDMQGRHRSLQASLDWSVKLLSEAARSGYGALAVFPGSFVRADVAGLMPAVGLPRSAADEVLDELIAAGLLARVQDEPRLRMLHLPRAHARAQAEARGQWKAVVTARLAEVCGWLDENPLEYESPQYAANLRRVMEIEDDAVSLLEHAQVHEPKQFVRMLVALCECWTTCGVFASVIRWVQRGIAAAQGLGLVEQELWLHANWVLALRREGQLTAAEEVSRALGPLCNQVSDQALVAFAIDTRTTALQSAGKSQEAVDLLKQTIARLGLREHSPGFWTLHASLWSLGSALPGVSVDLAPLRKRFAGSCMWPDILRTAFATWPTHDDFESLRAIADDLLASAKALRSKRFMLDGMWRRGACFLSLDQTAEGLQTFEDYYLTARGMGWSKGAAQAKRLMASLHLRNEDFSSAQACRSQLDDVAQPHASDAHGLAVPLLLAAVRVLEGDVAEAIRLLHTVPVDGLQRASDEDLVEWSEVAALVANRTGQAGLATELAIPMRRLDRSDDHVPIIRRFRDRHFGPGEDFRVRSAEELDELRQAIRAGLMKFYDFPFPAVAGEPAAAVN